MDVFEGWARLRLPVGVDESSLIYATPSYIRLASAVESTSCTPHTPGVILPFMALAMWPENPDAAMTRTRDEFLTAMGYRSWEVCTEQLDESQRTLTTTLSVVIPDSPPIVSVLRISTAEGHQVALVYDVSLAAWFVARETLLESARSLELGTEGSLSRPSGTR